MRLIAKTLLHSGTMEASYIRWLILFLYENFSIELCNVRMLNGLTQEHSFCSSLVLAYITVPFTPTELYYNMSHFFQNTAEIIP
jgi:hypothetical protein